MLTQVFEGLRFFLTALALLFSLAFCLAGFGAGFVNAVTWLVSARWAAREGHPDRRRDYLWHSLIAGVLPVVFWVLSVLAVQLAINVLTST
jgi:hypothetical protein